MNGLYDYLFKNVSVVTTDGRKYVGFCDMHETPYENESDEDSIGIMTNERTREGVEIYQSEIQSIEIID